MAANHPAIIKDLWLDDVALSDHILIVFTVPTSRIEQHALLGTRPLAKPSHVANAEWKASLSLAWRQLRNDLDFAADRAQDAASLEAAWAHFN